MTGRYRSLRTKAVLSIDDRTVLEDTVALRSKQRWPDVLASFSRTSRTASRIEDVFDALLSSAMSLLAADTAHLSRLDLPRGCLRVLRNVGALAAEEDEFPEHEIYLLAEYPQAQALAEKAQPWRGRVGDLTTSQADQDLLRRLGRRTVLSTPIISATSVWGELQVMRIADVPFTGRDLDLAEVLADLAGAAIFRLDSHEHLHRLAHTDPLTGLANRRSIDSQMEVWAGDLALVPSMAVVLCDVNGLKQVNDTFGHLAGDLLLREIGALVSAAAGRLPQGLAARIGGDEFLIAAPAPPVELTRTVVADLARDAKALRLGGGLAAGVAWGHDLSRPESSPAGRVRALLRLADAEQYRHKLAGRRTQTAPETQPGFSGSGMHRIDPAVIAELTTALCESRGTVQDRLMLTAQELCRAVTGAAWWVSRVDLAAGTVRAVACGTPRDPLDRDGLWADTMADAAVFRLADYPASATAVDGHSFFVDSRSGDVRERQLLVEMGFTSLICSGRPGPGDGEAWLVEVYGDGLTPALERAEPLLHVLTALAVTR